MYKIEMKKEIPLLIWLGVLAAISVFVYSRLPAQVPAHWDINGNIDGYASREFQVVFFPLLIAGIYIFTTLIPYVDPMKERYEHFLGVYRYIRTSIIGVLGAIYLTTLAVALGYSVSIPKIVGFTVGLLFVLLGNGLGKVKQNYFVGFRLPWTLNNEDNWNKTHRLAGKSMVAAGLIGMISSLLIPGISFVFLIGGVLMAVTIPTYYSYDLYKKGLKGKDKEAKSND